MMSKQMKVTKLKFDFNINLWVSEFENSITVYSRYQPVYQKGDVIKRIK